jgi:hypothetical protein
MLDRKIDHAFCSAEQQWSKGDPKNVRPDQAAFGDTNYLL